jgi:anthranilate synthase component I
MRKINYTTTSTSFLADVYTPVGIYLRLRDTFRDSVLLESNVSDAEGTNFSFIGINAIAGIEMINAKIIEYKIPNDDAKTIALDDNLSVTNIIEQFMQCFVASKNENFPLSIAQGLLGYMSYDAITLFEKIKINVDSQVPLLRFRFYQYIIAIDHQKDELLIIENNISGLDSQLQLLLTLLQKKDIPAFPFEKVGDEISCTSDKAFLEKVTFGKKQCQIGEVFQVVLSKKFEQKYIGDDFNVYRQLRNINPSSYLFYFDYGNYRIFGSSPESQLLIQDNQVTLHPIAGTIKRTSNDEANALAADKLINDVKENAEHTMLVDLARNDLSIFCKNVDILYFKKLKTYSHLMHLVSKVKGTKNNDISNINALSKSFPAGTLSGAPKYNAMQIISNTESEPRGYYGGTIGLLSFNGNCNMAIMIRTFFSKNNTLTYRAGAGVVVNSVENNELKEVHNKIAALQLAINKANLNK